MQRFCLIQSRRLLQQCAVFWMSPRRRQAPLQQREKYLDGVQRIQNAVNNRQIPHAVCQTQLHRLRIRSLDRKRQQRFAV